MLLISMAGSIKAQSLNPLKYSKKFRYEEVDLEGMIKRFMIKKPEPAVSVEGIYSVSWSATIKGTTLFSRVEKERVKKRKDNYATLAIMKDYPGSNVEYLVISLTKKNTARLPIVGDVNTLAEGNGFIYTHYQPDGTKLSYTFTFEKDTDFIEGLRTETRGNKTLIYKLSCVKIYPKKEYNASR